MSLLLPAAASAGTRTIELKDHLDIEWTDELLNYPFEADEGECVPASLRLEGPDGPMPVQLSDIEYWPDKKHVRSATLSFVADLPALTSQTYTVHFSPSRPDEPMPASALQVEQTSDQVTVTNGRFGFRAPLGEQHFEQPRDASKVPAPISGLRLADGTWFGGGDMFGDHGIVRYTARLVAAGPVFARVRTRYEYADGNTLDVEATLHSASRFVVIRTDSAAKRSENGFRLYIDRGLEPLTLHFQREYSPSTNRKVYEEQDVAVFNWAHMPLHDFLAENDFKLTPWADWWWDTTSPIIRLGIDDERELRIERRHAGRWVEPAVPGRWRQWGAMTEKSLSLSIADADDAYLHFNNARGERILQIGEHKPDPSVGTKPYRDHLDRPHGAQVKPETLRLDEVKDYILEWPQTAGQHPRLFLTPSELKQRWQALEAHPWPNTQEIVDYGYTMMVRRELPPAPKDEAGLRAYLITGGDKELAREFKLAERLEQHLELYGEFDRMRQTGELAALYDAMIDTDLIDEAKRAKMRAQMALVAYQLADPATWSMERGYRTYNPNMTLSYTFAQGLVALLLRDHPMADEWVKPSDRMMRSLIERQLSAHGEWFESMHYVHPAWEFALAYAIASRNAGKIDYFEEPALKKLGLYVANQYTPEDPRMRGERAVPPVGRGTAGMSWVMPGLFANATRDTDPEYASHMQFVWEGAGKPFDGSGLGGFEVVYCDPQLPTKRPDWGTVRYPNVSTIFRNGFGTPNEHYVNYLAVSDTYGTVRKQEVGSIVSWFAYGKPVSTAFTEAESFRMDRLMNQVTPAEAEDSKAIEQGNSRGRVRDEAKNLAFSKLPSADYSRTRYTLGEPTNRTWKLPDLPAWPEAGVADGDVQWQRQVLFMRSDDPAELHYLVLNDTVLNDQPTRWQFWTHSQKLGPTTDATQSGFLSDAPGQSPAPARELQGDRFTAIGQFGVDLDYFVASPSDTPRHTLRYGGQHRGYRTDVHDYQDLLHLQLPGSGRYYVAMIPRKPNDAQPDFEQLSDGKVIRVRTQATTDYILLSDEAVTAHDDNAGVAFDTNGGIVRRHDNGESLIVLEKGRVASGDIAIESSGPAELHREGGHWRLKVDPGETYTLYDLNHWDNYTTTQETPMASIDARLTFPEIDSVDLSSLPESVKVERSDKWLHLTIPGEVRELTFK